MTTRGQTIPLGRIVEFAVATAMWQEQICTLLWTDVDFAGQLAIVRNRKDPRRRSGNHQKVPLLDVTGYDAIALLREQQALRCMWRNGICEDCEPALTIFDVDASGFTSTLTHTTSHEFGDFASSGDGRD